MTHHLKSWLPVDAVINKGRPGIEWLDMTGVALTEPFFHQTVARVRNERASSPPLITDFDELIRLEKISRGLTPSGFIFHTSRCGSTLVANSCRALEGALVVAEPPVLDKLISRFFTDTDEVGTKELFYSVLLKCAVSALGQRRLGNERRYFIKFAAASILQFHRIRRIWPTVPAIFLYRDPVEVIVSNLQNIPEWMMIESNPKTSAAIVGVAEDDLTSISPEEFCARALGRFYSAAASVQDENSLLCNYNKLSAETLLRLIEFFRVHIPQEEADRIRQNASLYSKEPSRSFRADGDLKRVRASERVKELAKQWALQPYQHLIGLEEPKEMRLHPDWRGQYDRRTDNMDSSTPVPLNDVIFTDFEGGEGILVDLNTKQYYRLNETGALIWRGLEKGSTIEDIVSEMQNLYDVSREHALMSVDRLLTTLESNKLVKRN